MIGYLAVCVLTAGVALIFFFIAIPIAYVVGAIPAVLTAIGYWASRRRGLEAPLALGLAVVFGAATSILAVPSLSALSGNGWSFDMGWLTGSVGGATSGVCAWLVERRKPQRSAPLDLANFD